MPLDPAVLDVVDLAYQAAIEPDLWQSVLAATARVFDAEKSIFLTPGRQTASGALSSGFEPEALDLYFGCYRAINPIQAGINARISALQTLPSVSTDQTWVDRDLYLTSAYYNDFGRVFDIHGCLLINMAGPTLNVLRSASRGDFAAADAETAAFLQGPLSRAHAMGRRLDAEQRSRGGLAELLSQAAGALVAADARGRVVYASPAAEAIFAAADGLTVQSGMLSAGSADGTRSLVQAIGRAIVNGAGAGLAAHRPSGRRPLAILVTPAQTTGAGGRLALISISDPEPRASDVERLSELFGLTLGEGRVVAQLAAGHDARAIAERLGLSFHTVRAQLARALAKTDTRRQAELVALVVRALSRLN